MDSRDLLNKSDKIFIFLDSDSIINQLEKENRYLIAVLDYVNLSRFVFFRSDCNSGREIIQKVPEYQLYLKDDHETNPMAIGTLVIPEKDKRKGFPFGYKMGYIPLYAQQIFGKEELNEQQFNAIKQILVQAALCQFAEHSSNKSDSCIFITENNNLLRNRLSLERQFNFPLNIMNINEGNIFLDLVLKKNNIYLIRENFCTDKGYYYWLSLRSKIPHLSKFNPISTAISYRAEYALMAVDEMGIQYFLGANNDTKDNSLYHFNYLIILISGIFDNLALLSDQELNINYKDKRQIGLSKSGSKLFLREIRERRPDIREHIHNYVDFINLIYSFREDIVHRAGLPSMIFQKNSKSGGWKAQFIEISEEMAKMIKMCGDKKRDYDSFSEYGVYNSGDIFYVIPYILAISLVRSILQFIDEYLSLLNYPLTSDLKTSNQDLIKELSIFERYHLGM
jgi:hypothetical protein